MKKKTWFFKKVLCKIPSSSYAHTRQVPLPSQDEFQKIQGSHRRILYFPSARAPPAATHFHQKASQRAFRNPCSATGPEEPKIRKRNATNHTRSRKILDRTAAVCDYPLGKLCDSCRATCQTRTFCRTKSVDECPLAWPTVGHGRDRLEEVRRGNDKPLGRRWAGASDRSNSLLLRGEYVCFWNGHAR